jgi:hypothetical protein
MQAAFGSDGSTLSPGLHSHIWAVLEPITSDPDPVAADDLPANYDPTTHSLNTIRGQALRAVIGYALWRARSTRQKVEGTPEGAAIIAVLNEHLTQGEALAILAIYGELFPELLYLFPNWATLQLDAIFPTDTTRERMWNATWPAYVVFCPPYKDVAVALRSKYLYAASHLDAPYDDWSTLAPADKLIQHVLSLYLRGEIELHDELITLIFAHSSTEQRARMPWFTASSLQEIDCDASVELVSRSQRLWDVLFANRSPRPEPDELRSFGWFALTDCVPPSWFLGHLTNILGGANGVACEHGVIRRLAALADQYTAAVVDVTLLFARASVREFGVEAWRKELGVILNAATHADALTRGRAIELIDYLGQQGVRLENYRSLIELLSHV